MLQRYPRSFFVRHKLALGLVWLTLVGLAFPSSAQEAFDYNYILSDNDLTDYQSMSLEHIQAFLELKGSKLATYVEPITSLKASQIIYTSAQDFQINPKFLVALIQKEQSLIEDTNPPASAYDWATGYAVCDGCSTSDPLLQRYKGFYNQVYNAAKKIRTSYLPDLIARGKTVSGYGPGITKLVDGTAVTPVNNATAVLYTYTPHLHGNRLLGSIWNRFFARSYPDGSLLNVQGENSVWLIENGERRQFASRAVYLSRYPNFDRVLEINRNELLKYPEGKPIALPNYSFLRSPRGTVYLLVDEQIRGFDSREALRRVGVNPEEIINVSQEDLANYGEGQPITPQSLYPLGALLQDNKSGGIYWVKDGVKHPLWSKEIMTSNFAGKKITPRLPKDLEQFPTSTPVLFREGDLVRSKSSPAVYLISNKQRRPFVSEQAFSELHYDFKNLITTSDEALMIHELGLPISATY